MELYRLTRRKYAGTDPFDGEGSFLFGGRWSSAGTRVCYTSTHRSLAILEYWTHLDPAVMPDDLVLATLAVPDDIRASSLPTIPASWRDYPASVELRSIGDRFIAERKHALLRVPSVIVPEEHNILLNPAHPDAGKMIRQPELATFAYDRRLL